MESKKFNFVIGLFVVAGIAGIFIIGLWLAKTGSNEKITPYEVLFKESVSGLSVGSKVSYRGIRIGSVTSIGIKPDDPQFVLVRIAVKEEYPIHQGDIASLKIEGITGTSYIDIEGAEWDSELIESTPENPATIPSRRSELGRLVKGLPDLINEGTILAQRFSEMVNDKNREQVTAILVNIKEITTMLAEQGENINTVMVTAEDAGNELIAVSRSLQNVATKLDSLVDTLQVTANDTDRLINDEGTELINEWKTTAQSWRELSDTAQNFLVVNEDSLRHFSQEGLYEFTLFLQEARYLIAGLSRVVDRIESSGARFLLDQHNPEIDPN
jgi:phospholipid/cholesterol/gamma-HCH transport system substrate-binding protein